MDEMADRVKDRVEARLTNGLLGQWYAVAKSVQVKPESVHAVKILNRNLVLWRDRNGVVNCLEDYCPHRGAKLSHGQVVEAGLSCRYHGVTLDGRGTIVRVPAMPGCPLEGRHGAQSFIVYEANDAVFVYVPSAERPDPPSFVLPEEFTSPEWASFLCMGRWKTNYRYAYDNVVDPMHGSYLHAESFTLAYGEKQDVMRLDKTTGDGFIVTRVGQQNVNFDWTEVVFEDGEIYCRLDIPYPAAAGPGGPFRIIGFVTPIDEHECYVFFWRCRQISGLARESWRFLYRMTLEARHWHVLEQDRDILETIPHDAHRREMLYQHDIGLSRLRQIMLRKAKTQIAVEDAAKTTASVRVAG